MRSGARLDDVRGGRSDRRRVDRTGRRLRDSWLVGELATSLPQARLRLGQKAGAAAKHAVDELTRTLDLLENGTRSADDARAAYEQASAAEDEFVRAARAESGD